MGNSGGRKVGSGTVKKGPISTTFKDCVSPVPGQSGNWGGQRNGADVAGGAKGTGGLIDEVTTVEVHGGGSSGSKVNAKKIANRSKY